MTYTLQLMYDGIHADVPKIPANAEKVAGYVSGANHEFWWTSQDWARFPTAAHVRIDTDGSKPLASDVVDCESGDVSPAGAARWAKTRQDAHLSRSVYCSESALPAVRAAMAAAGVTNALYWIAHWGITQAEAAAKISGDIVAVQFSSPSTHPGQGYDLSVARSDWFSRPVPPTPTPPPPLLDGILITLTTGNAPHTYTGRGVTSRDGGKTWS